MTRDAYSPDSIVDRYGRTLATDDPLVQHFCHPTHVFRQCPGGSGIENR
jgi:hypothetical protein